MPDAMTHPSLQELSDFGLGRLSAEAATTIAGHLETCPACQQAVAELPPDSFLGKVQAAKPGQSSMPQGRSTARADAVDWSNATAVPPEGLPPELAGYSKYHFVRELGRGGMGVVYLAEQTLMKRRVAIKVINPGVLAHPSALPRFQAEVQAAATLDHPNIVRAHDAEQVGGLHLLVMEFVEGTNLADLVQRKGPLPVAHASHFIRQAALGLQHAFEQGMIHRDIKPHNLMVTPKGQVKILDFGLARLRSGGRGLTELGSFMGTPEYVSPEQATDAHTADTRADLYSLGCTLYFLLTGRPPFPDDNAVKVILAHIEKEAPPVQELRPEVPAELSAVVARLLAKDPAQRFQTPVEVARVLVPFIKQGTKREGVSLPPLALPVSERGTVLGANTSKVLKARENPASQPPVAPPVVAEQPAAPFADLVDTAAPLTKEKRVRPMKTAPAAWFRDWRVLTGTGAAVLILGWIGLWAAGVLKVTTPHGIIVLQDVPADAEVNVTGPTVTLTRNGEEVQVTAVSEGPYRLKIIQNGQEIWSSGEVRVNLGGDPVRLKAPPLASAQHKQAAVALPLQYTNKLGMEFVLIPKGKSWLGGGGGKPGTKEVEIVQDFYLGKYEVTQEEWEKVTGLRPSYYSRTRRGRDKVKEITDAELKRFPVEDVSWDDAQSFLERLNKRERDTGWVYRLPKDAEWEYACRGGPLTDRFDSAYHFYFDKPTNQLLPEQANFDHSKGLKRTCRVGSYKPNRLGLYDMHGNVREWCNDGAPTADGASHREVRGGSYWTGLSDGNLRAANPYHCPPSSRAADRGLRVARVPVGKEIVRILPVDRRAAEAVLSCGGTVQVRVAGKEVVIASAAKVPAENFEVLEINLNSKQLGAEGLAPLDGLTSLRRLELDKAKPVTDAGLIHLKDLTNLSALSLSRTEIGDAGLAHLQDLTKLQELYLFSVPVTDAGLGHLKDLTNLRTLNLNATRVTDAGLVHLSGLKNLHHLDLMSTRVTGVGFVQIKGLTDLEVLYLAYSTLGDIGLVHLEGLKHLRVLGLNHTRVSGAGLVHLKDLTSLALLDLRNLSVSDIDLLHLHGLKGLRDLNLTKTKVTSEGVAALQKALPNCRIRTDPDTIKPNEPTTATSPGAGAGSDAKGFVPLFNGNDLSGWVVDGDDAKAWGAAHGELTGRGKESKTSSYLLTERVYADFRLRLEFNLARGARSGVALRALQREKLPLNGLVSDHPVFKLIDDRGNVETGTTHWVLNATSVAPSRSAELKPAGSWNQLEMEVKGRSVQAWVNDKQVLNVTLAEGARLADGSIPALNRSRGRIGLQQQTGTVRFRNIAIKELPAVAGRPKTPHGFPVFIPEKDWGKWRVGDNYLEQTASSGFAYIYFGETTWSDYDYTVDFLRVRGNDQCGLFFLQDGEKKQGCLFGLNTFGSSAHSVEWWAPSKPKRGWMQRKGSLRSGAWHTARVSVRSGQVQCFLDGHKLFDCTIDSHSNGRVGLRTCTSSYRFRNIKVTDPQGKLLLEGRPDLESALDK